MNQTATLLREPQTVGSRLRAEVNRWGSIRGFAAKMQERGVRGATRTMIYRYLNDEVPPPLEFIRAASGVLGVREEWLENGQGPRTHAAEQEREAATALTDASGEPFSERYPWLEGLSPAVTTTFWLYGYRSREAAERLGIADFSIEEALDIAEECLFAPLIFWRKLTGKALPLDPEDFTTYANTVLTAFAQAVHIAAPPYLTKEDFAEIPDNREEE